MLLTRIFPVADVGVYFVVLSLVLILGPLANVGLQEPTLRAIASFTATGDNARAAAVAGSALKLGIATAGLLSALVAVVWAGLCKAGLFLTEQDLLTGAFVACWMALVAVKPSLLELFRDWRRFASPFSAMAHFLSCLQWPPWRPCSSRAGMRLCTRFC